MERLVNEIIKLLDSLYKNGQLNNYFIEEDERKWVNLIKDILTVKFDFPWGNDTAELAQEIYDEYIVAWKGQQKFKGMLHTESKNTIRLTESELKSVISESVKQIISELDWKTYANAAKKSKERGEDWTRAKRFNRAADERFRDKYGLRKKKNNGYALDSDFYTDVPYVALDSPDSRGYIAYGDKETPFTKNVGSVYASYDVPTDEYDNPALERVGDDVFGAQKELEDYRYGNYEYTKGKGWHLKDNE